MIFTVWMPPLVGVSILSTPLQWVRIAFAVFGISQHFSHILCHKPDFTTALTLENANSTECNHRRLTGNKDDKENVHIPLLKT